LIHEMVACEQFWRASCVLIPLRIPPALFLVVRRLALVRIGDIAEHEATPFTVAQDAAFAADAFGDQNAANAGRPDHAGRVELHKFHVHQLGARVVRQRMAIPGVFPTIARDLIGASDATGRENDGLRPEQLEAAPLALVSKRPGDAAIV
jgi:hypothetical protein